MFVVKNNIEDKSVFSGNEREFISFVEGIVIENEDLFYSVLGVSDAIDYIVNYCDNLVLLTN